MTRDRAGDISSTTSRGPITINSTSSARITIGMCFKEKYFMFGSNATTEDTTPSLCISLVDVRILNVTFIVMSASDQNESSIRMQSACRREFCHFSSILGHHRALSVVKPITNRTVSGPRYLNE